MGNPLSPLQGWRSCAWAALWGLLACLGTFLWWQPVFHAAPYMLFLAAVALTVTRSGVLESIAVALCGLILAFSLRKMDLAGILFPSISMVLNSGIIIFLGSSVRKGLTARQEEEAYRQSLGDAVADFLWSCRADGAPVYINDRMLAYAGLTMDEFIGQGWQKFLHPEDWQALAERYATNHLDAGKYQTDARFRRHDGAYRWFMVRVVPLRDRRGTILKWLGTCTDVHEQHLVAQARADLLEREKQARLAAENSSRMKDEFLATLSHELRTPLNAIFGWIHLLQSGDNDEAQIQEGLSIIDRNVRTQAQLIGDLLDMSAIVTGKVRLDRQSVDLPAIVLLAIDSARPAAEAKNISLRQTLDPEARPIHGDPARLQQIAWNLLSNAIKFTPRDGSVEISLSRSGDQAELLIRDTGEGIRPDLLPHIFERFRQGDASITRRHGGLGLGLAITRQLVELHGGNIVAESPGPGQGSAFRVHLPLSNTAESPVPPSQPASTASAQPGLPAGVRRLAGVKILVIDDEQDSRDIARKILLSGGAVVTTAASASEALQLLQKESFQALVSDIGMPGMSGYEFISQVRALPVENLRGISALALTAFAHAEDRQRALAAGFDQFLSKPVEPSELIASVARLL